jgi:hypothetical protein
MIFKDYKRKPFVATILLLLTASQLDILAVVFRTFKVQKIVSFGTSRERFFGQYFFLFHIADD